MVDWNSVEQTERLVMDRTLKGSTGYPASNGSQALTRYPQLSNSAWLPAIGALMCTPIALCLCKIVIGIVSGYDVFLTIKYVESLPMMEMNPFGRWLMNLNYDLSRNYAAVATVEQTAGFITAKLMGNFIVFGVIELLANWRRRAAAVVATSLASFQICLLAYLLFANG